MRFQLALEQGAIAFAIGDGVEVDMLFCELLRELLSDSVKLYGQRGGSGATPPTVASAIERGRRIWPPSFDAWMLRHSPAERRRHF